MNIKKYITVGKFMFFTFIIISIYISFSYNLTKALEEQTDGDQVIEKEATPEIEEMANSLVTVKEQAHEPLSSRHGYHLGDVAVINNLIKYHSLDLPYDAPDQWNTVSWYVEEQEEGMGRRIQRLNFMNRGLTGSIDLRELEYLVYLDISLTSVTEVHISGMRHLDTFMSMNTPLLTQVDLSNLNQLSGVNLFNNPQLTSVTIEGSHNIQNFLLQQINDFERFTNANGVTLNIEKSGSGAVMLNSYNHSLQQFTLTANPGRHHNFSHWMATPKSIEFDTGNTTNSNPATFTLNDDADVTITAFFNLLYHLGDVDIINNLIENHSLNLPYDAPDQWNTVSWYVEEQEDEKGMGRRIRQLMISNRQVTGAIDLRELEYLLHLDVSSNQITELHLSSMSHLSMIIANNNPLLLNLDLSNLDQLQSVFVFSNPNLTSVSIEGSHNIGVMMLNQINNFKQFTNANGDTLNIEKDGPGDVMLSSYNHSLREFTLTANATGTRPTSGFSHWEITPNSIDLVSRNLNKSNPIIFSMRDGVDATVTAWFDPATFVSAPLIDENSITATEASFNGMYNAFGDGDVQDFSYEYRRKGEDTWTTVSRGIEINCCGNGLQSVKYSGSFANNNITLEPGTTYEIRVMILNQYEQRTFSEVSEFTTHWIVTIRNVESLKDGQYNLLDEEIIHIPNGVGIDIAADQYLDLGLIGLHYRVMKSDGSGDIEDTTHALGTPLNIFDNTIIIVYHTNTVVELSYPKEMEFYANYSNGGMITTNEDYVFTNHSALPAMVNLNRYDVIDSDGINFVASASNDDEVHFSLIPTSVNNNGFTNKITNMQPNTPLNRSLGTLGGYATGGNSIGSFTVGGQYIGLFTQQPRRPTLQFVFSFELDWDALK